MVNLMERFKGICFMILFIIPLLALSLTGCGKGNTGAAGSSSGTVSGTVTNKTTGTPVVAVSVSISPAMQGVSITTGSDGTYSAILPIGTYTLTFKKTNFTDYPVTVAVVADVVTTTDVALVPTSPVVINAGVAQTSAPGGTVNLTATVDVMDGSTITSYAWVQTGGVGSTIINDTTAAATITLGNSAAYKTELVKKLVNLASTTYPAGFVDPLITGEGINGAGDVDTKEGLVLDKIQALGMSNDARTVIAGTTYMVTVTTTSGTYSGTVNVSADISPFAAKATGLQNVPVNLPVLLHAKTNAAGYNWTLLKPLGTPTAATLNDSTTQNPYFTPDVPGKYTATESISGKSLDIYAGKWVGAVGSTDAGAGVTLSGNCVTCHNSSATGDALSVFLNRFVPWSQTGHAQILQKQINNQLQAASDCLDCHALGYNTTAGADNNGFDDVATTLGFNYDSFISNGGKYEQMDSKLQALSNVQCEHCHGPSVVNGIDVTAGESLHNNGTVGDKGRVSIAADVCGSCHGKAMQDARYQMWQRSAHAFGARQQDRAGIQANGNLPSMSCVRCHSGEGFLYWKKNYLDKGDSRQLRAVEVTWKAEDAHTQTCPVCHDPHDTGTGIGNLDTIKVRISGDTPMLPAGFKAQGVGRGAMCMTCHNSRNGWSSNDPDAAVQGILGLHEDGDKVWDPANQTAPPASGAPQYNLTYGAPHQACQTDVFMGRNAWFIGTNALRSRHSFIKDTCANCHMVQTPAPADLAFANADGTTDATNHTFKAKTDICGNCHGSFNDASGLQAAVQAQIDQLAAQMGGYLLSKLPATFYIASGKQVAKADIAGIPTPVEASGQMGFRLTFTAGSPSATTMGNTTANVGLGNFTITGLYPASASNVANVSYDGAAKTITRAAGTWPAEFIVGGKITTNSPFNPGPFTITAVTSTVITVAENVNTLAASTRSVTQVVTAAQQADKVIDLTDNLVKAGWNYFLINAGSALGVHNPSFAVQVLDLSISKLPLP